MKGSFPILPATAGGCAGMCQRANQHEYSRLSRPYPIMLVYRLFWYWKTTGVRGTLGHTLRFIRSKAKRTFGLTKRPSALQASAKAPDFIGLQPSELVEIKSPREILPRGIPASAKSPEVLGLQPGELVEVKSENEILETLDGDGRTRGLAFLPEMRQYCGERFRVFKRVERIFLEESQQARRIKDTVFLDGVYCGGMGIGCDKSCFFFWRESWLKRVEEGTTPIDINDRRNAPDRYPRAGAV